MMAPAARGGPARRPAGAGRRPRPALLGRRRRGADRPGPRLRGPRRQPGRGPAPDPPLRRGDRRAGRGAARRRRRRRARGAPRPGTTRSSGSPTDDPAVGDPRHGARRGAGRPRRAAAGDGPRRSAALDRHRLLCAHRDGPFGVRHWNRRVERWLAEETGDPLYDVGTSAARCWSPPTTTRWASTTATPASSSTRPAGVRGSRCRERRSALDLAPARLDDVETMHAMTIHKSQGSQADGSRCCCPTRSRGC